MRARPRVWFDAAAAAGAADAVSWRALHDAGHAGEWQLAMPITPPEVWGCGVTYRRSADFREEGLGIYDRIYEADRPELFYKASAAARWVRTRRSAGAATRGSRRPSPRSRSSSRARGAILGFTLANDVSAWDIERDNPLYLPQSKIYTGCFSCGPADGDARRDRRSLRARADLPVERGGARSSAAPRPRHSSSAISGARTWLLRSNNVPTGTVLSTGTGIIQPIETGLEPGDTSVCRALSSGTLRNPVALVWS